MQYKVSHMQSGEWVVVWHTGGGLWARSGREVYATKTAAQAVADEMNMVSIRAVRAQSACLRAL